MKALYRFHRNIRNWMLGATLAIASMHLARSQAPDLGATGSAKPSAVTGQVMDEQEAAIIAARIRLHREGREDLYLETNNQGKFAFAGLEAGTYTISISADNFAAYENQLVRLGAGQTKNLNVILRIQAKKEQITVFSGNPFTRGAELAGSSVILRGEAISDLPDGPGGLEELLRAMALRTGGPFGPDIFVDGFENNPIPPKESIREIRINDNPFSAEYRQLGLGRIEILTKPGTDAYHADLNSLFGDASLNSRNPYAPNRAPFQSLLYGGDVSGPIVAKRATFFVDFLRQADRSNAVINATVLDPAFRIMPFAQAVVTPLYQHSFGPRLDLQLNSRNTLVARYSENRSEALNTGVGGLSLISEGQNSTSATQTYQLTETAVLGGSSLAETRLQYVHSRVWQSGNDSTALINVPGSFTGGGANVGLSYNNQNTAELSHFVTWQARHHIFKLGIQVNYFSIIQGSNQNFNGTYTFNGGLAPQLTTDNQVVASGDGNPIMIPITGIEAYRRTLLLGSEGLTPSEVRQLGGGASQLSLTAGQIQTGVKQYEIGEFLQDDWRIRPKFSLSIGLRYEYQTNIGDKLDFAPRVGFTWGLGGGKEEPKTVVHGGVGIFYSRVGAQTVLRSLQMNGKSQRQFFTATPSILDLFPAVPSTSTLANFAVQQSVVELASNIRAPYTAQASLSIERHFNHGVSIASTYMRLRSVHLLLSRNLNAPLPGTYNSQIPGSGDFPYYGAGNIFEYESSGVLDQNQLLLNFVYRASKRMSLWSTYTFSRAKSNTDGPDSFPANSYDLRADYGRSSLDVHHAIYWGGWIRLKGDIDLIPLILWRSGLPFNITTGIDNNGDSLFTDRPAFASDLTRPSVVVTRFGAFDLNPIPGEMTIPRNYGQGPDFLIANLRISKKIQVSERFAIVMSMQAQNVLNHTNAGFPIGILSSPLFGTSNSSAGDWGLGSNAAGNRRLLLGLSLVF